MKLGMPTLIEAASLEECVSLCTKLGLDFIELNMNFPECQIQNLRADVLNQIQKEKGIFFTIHLDENLSICDFNKEVVKAYLKTVKDTIALAKQIGAPIINMHLAQGIYITLPDRKVYLFEQYKAFYLEHIRNFRMLCEEAIGDSDIKICVENTEGFKAYEQEAIECLLESECFGLTLDIGHSHVVGDQDEMFYKKHINRLIHMHLHDANQSSNHLALGSGEIDLSARLKLAEQCGCRVVLETKTIEALNQSISYLKEKRFL